MHCLIVSVNSTWAKPSAIGDAINERRRRIDEVNKTAICKEPVKYKDSQHQKLWIPIV
jgi:hypothetical protein